METAASRDCPFCGGAILPRALQCRHCRRWMPEARQGPEGEPAGEAAHAPPASASAAAGDPAAEPSNAQPVTHLILLTLLSFTLYELYWFYRNWRDLERERGQEDGGVVFGPGLRTVGLIVPILNIALVYDQLRRIRETSEDAGLVPEFAPATTALVFFLLMYAANVTGWWMVSLLTVFPLVPVQIALNRYWSVVHPERPMRESVTAVDVAIVVAGIASVVAISTWVSFG